MKLTAREIKDRRIIRAGLAYVAEVHLYNGAVIGAGRHLTLISAQRSLSKYPSEVFEGNDDPTRAKRNKKRPHGTDLRPYQSHRRQCDNYLRLYDRRV